MGHGLSEGAVQVRVGTGLEPGRCESVASQERGRRGHGGRCARPAKEAPPDDDHGGPLPSLRPDLRADRAALSGKPQTICRRLCPGVVQTDPPRHGTALALSRCRGSQRRTSLAGRNPCRKFQTDQQAGHRLPQGQDSGFRSVCVGTGNDCLGVGFHLPWFRHARRSQWRTHSSGAAEGLGSKPACPADESAQNLGAHPESIQQRPGGR